MRQTVTAAVAAFVLVVGGLTSLGCASPDTVRTHFTVEGMHCDACSSAITTALEKTEGVVEASADHETGTADVVYHARQVEVEALEAEIEGLGYTVTGETTERVES